MRERDRECLNKCCEARQKYQNLTHQNNSVGRNRIICNNWWITYTYIIFALQNFKSCPDLEMLILMIKTDLAVDRSEEDWLLLELTI